MRGGRLAKRQWRQLRKLSETVCQQWQEPDSGIWEIRSAPRHNMHSKVMCWRALDNLLTMHAHGHLSVPVDRLQAVRDTIGEAIEREGYNEEAQSYVQAFGNRMPDASLLRLPGTRSGQGHVQDSAQGFRVGPWMLQGLTGQWHLPDDARHGQSAFGCSLWWPTRPTRHREAIRERCRFPR
jgi:hypothetical protein